MELRFAIIGHERMYLMFQSGEELRFPATDFAGGDAAYERPFAAADADVGPQ